MSKPSRRKRPNAQANGHGPSPVQDAIARIATADQPVIFSLPVHPMPVRLKPDQVVAIVGPSDANDARILVRGDDDLWRGILIPPGSRWELRKAQAGPQLWTPPGTAGKR